ncbi:tandem-95 repeat protein [Aestuariibacter sp. AA17]|uniref:Tandem-95 repeat protein n=1 Tax=Fluctibacter corallii TaxID=2984329 RepID=A0ABT3A5U2_9ALTE|nr:tandem-95 repeat protein [Aestuariibacter sp. AA17]MCV2884058.1 tandem-95 repeat protein [Aestuariibacter sp. AA17]
MVSLSNTSKLVCGIFRSISLCLIAFISGELYAGQPNAWLTYFVNLDIDENNKPPVLVDERFTILEDETLSDINVLENDSDPDNDALRIVAAYANEFGQVSINTNQTLTFTPATDFYGEAIITYHVSDGVGHVKNAYARVTVEPINDIPEVNFEYEQLYSGGPENAISLTVFDAESDATQIYDLAVSEGSVSMMSNSLTYFAPEDFAGDVVLSFWITDGINPPQFIERLLSILEHPAPKIIGQQPIRFDEDEWIELTPSMFTIKDPDSSQFYFKLDDGLGTLSETLRVKPYKDAHGERVISVVLSDGEYESAPFDAKITVNSINDAPRDLAHIRLEVVEGSQYRFNFQALYFDPEAHQSLELFQSFKYDISKNRQFPTDDPERTRHGTLKPLSRTLKNGIVYHWYLYTPDPGFVGLDVFFFTVADNEGKRSTEIGEVVLAVESNRPPSWEKSVVSIGEPTFLNDVNSLATYCHAEGYPEFSIDLTLNMVRFFSPTPQGKPLKKWVCKNWIGQVVQQFESPLLVEKIPGPRLRYQ